jgi:hypothetical protein
VSLPIDSTTHDRTEHMNMQKAAPKPTDIKPPFTEETAQAKVKAAENA